MCVCVCVCVCVYARARARAREREREREREKERERLDWRLDGLLYVSNTAPYNEGEKKKRKPIMNGNEPLRKCKPK